MAIRKKQEPSEYQKALRKFHKKSNRHVVVFEADYKTKMKSDVIFRMRPSAQNVEMNSSVLRNEIWGSFCAQRDIVPCRNCMEKYRIQSMHWKRKKFYQMRKHKS